jgi:quercetin dioxygenase-like cupin family protein
MSVITVQTKHSFTYDTVRLNVFHANKGEGLSMHGHEYSHATMCNAGSCRITLDNGKSRVIDKNSIPVNLLAGIQHEIEALEDDTVFVNVFAEGKQ